MEKSKYPWRRVFVAALTGIDSENCSDRLSVADDAVFERLLALEGTLGTEEERMALEDTMQDVRLLRAKSYHFDAWK